MKSSYQLVAMTLALGFGPAVGQVEIGRMLLGSGEPGQPGFENATPIDNNIYHAPQYLPGFPTAASIWPRVVEVPCRTVGAGLQCDGYNWTPRMGRAEYLYFMPVVVAAAPVAEVPAVLPPLAPAAPAAAPPMAEAVTPPPETQARPAKQARE